MPIRPKNPRPFINVCDRFGVADEMMMMDNDDNESTM